MKTGGPRLDATENSIVETGADSSAETVHAGDKTGTTAGWKLAGASICPLATAQTEHVPCGAEESLWNREWKRSLAANRPSTNSRPAINPARMGLRQPARGSIRCDIGAI